MIPSPAGAADERVAEADEAARRHVEVDAHVAVVVGVHAGHLRLAAGEGLDEEAGRGFGRFDVELLERLFEAALGVVEDDLGAGDRELVALAAHGLDEDGEVQLAAAADDELLGAVAVFDAEGDVGLDFAVEAFAELAAGDELALAARERRVVHAEGHLHRRLFDGDDGQRLGDGRVGDGFADEDVGDAGEGDDVAGGRLLELDAAETLEAERLDDAMRASSSPRGRSG